MDYWRKGLCLFLSFALLLGNFPVVAYAVEENGLCEHHTEHIGCGYAEASDEVPCNHVCGEDCYVTQCAHGHKDCGYTAAVEGAECKHEHDETCGYQAAVDAVDCNCMPTITHKETCAFLTAEDNACDCGALPIHEEGCAFREAVEESPCIHTHDATCGYAEAKEEVSCTHVCNEEEGCSLNTLSCQHKHDEVCGYRSAVEAHECEFVCEDCAKSKEETSEPTECDHSWDDGIVTTEATPDSPGLKTFTCSSCGETRTEEIPFVCSHEWDEGEFLRPAEGDTPAVFLYTCTLCGETEERSLEAENYATSGTCGENVTWTLDDEGLLTISGTGAMYDYAGNDSDESPHGRTPWVRAWRYKVFSVVIEEGITSIGNYAFWALDNLESVIIPESVTQIRDYAFSGCDSLRSVIIPGSVTSMGYQVFSLCYGLSSVVFCEGVTDLGGATFISCKSLKNVIIPDGITKIGSYVFSCALDPNSVLKSIYIPKSVTDIETWAFAGCVGLTDVYYGGTEKDREAININTSNNYYLLNATWHYRAEPIEGGVATPPVPENEIGFYIYDALSGYPIEGAKVTIVDSGAEKTTAADGAVSFLCPNEVFSLSVEADGYVLKNLFHTPETPGVCIPISLQPYNLKPVISSVIFDNGHSDTMDVLEKKIVLTEGDPQGFSLTVDAQYMNQSGDTIKQYRLIQGGTIKKTSETGVFENLKASDFDVEKKVYVQVVSENYVKSDLMESNLQIRESMIPDSEKEPNIKIGEGFEITLDQSIPFLGGETITLDLFELPVSVEINGDDVRIGINLKAKTSDGTQGFFDKDAWDAIKKGAKEKRNPAGYVLDFAGVELAQNVDGLLFAQIGNSKIEYEAWGYLEGNFSKLTGEIVIKIQSKNTIEGQLSFTIPIVYTLSLNAEGEADFKVSNEWRKLGDLSNLRITGNFSPSIELGMGIGAGYAKLISGTVNGSGNLKYTLTLDKDAGTSQLLQLIIRGYVKFKVLFAENEKTFAEKTWTLWDDTGAASQYSLRRSVPMSRDDFQIAGRDYLAEQTGWLAGVSTFATNGWDTNMGILQSSVYEDPQIQIASWNNTAVAFFLTDDGTRNAVDRTMLVYSIFDQHAGIWKEPVAVENDGTADFLPSVYSDGTNLYVTWVDFHSQAADTTDMESLAAMAEIKVAKMNTDGTFTVSKLTNNSTYDTMPTVLAKDGKVYVAWINNDSNDLLCSQGSNTVVLSTIEGTELWSKDVGSVSELVLASQNGNVTVACITDEDRDYFTAEDRTLTLWDASGSATAICHGEISEVNAGSQGITWLQEGVLTSTAGNYLGLTSPISSAYQIMDTGDKVYVLFLNNVDDEASDLTDVELFAYIYDKELQTWGNAVQLSETGESIQQIRSFVDNQGNVRSLLSVANFSLSGDTYSSHTDLCHMTIKKSTDLQIGQVHYSDVAASTDGQDIVQFSTTVINNGTETINGCRLVLSQDGTTLDAVLLEGPLSPGTSVEVGDTFTIPTVTEQGTYTVSVECDVTDENLDNNNQSITLGMPDLSVTYEANCHAGIHVLSVRVVNDGRTATSGTLDVRLGSESGERLYSTSVITLNPGESSNYIVTLNANTVGAVTENQLIFLCIEPAVVDSNVGNNSDCYVMTQKEDYITVISVTPESQTLEVDQSVQLQVTLNNDILDDNLSVTYSSSNPSAATVSDTGLVTAVGKGNADIIISVGEYKTTCFITVVNCNHSWQEATCTTPKKCERCGVTQGSALSHSWKDATCADPKTCRNCGATEGNALDHSYKKVITAPTCTEGGYTTYTCDCGDTYTDVEVGKLDHTGGTATCKDKAVCTRCEESYGELNPNNHVGGTEIRNTKIVTCTEDGYTGDIHCVSCGGKLTGGEVIKAPGHDMGEWEITEDATCTENGLMRKKCSRCEHFETEVITAKGHNHEGVYTPPTCTEDGYTTCICVCGDSYIIDRTPAHGHIMIAGNIVKEATCTESGEQRRDCDKCDYFETNIIAAIGHSHELAEVISSTCTETGYATFVCACGDTYKTYDVGPKGHSYAAVVTAPTCVDKGHTTHTCSACGDSYVDTYVDALSHDLGEWTVVTEPAPGADGQERRDCGHCDYYETRSTQYQGNVLMLEGEDLLSQSVVYINGLPYAVKGEGENRYVELPNEEDCYIVIYSYHVGDASDVHTQYPTGMKAYKVEDGKITYIPELDNLLQYSGSSIRITGKKGIRMITSLTKDVKAALTGDGLAGYKLLEYGTALCFASEVAGDGDLVLGKPYTRSNYAYKKDVADPVFANSGNLTQYTNVLVGFSLDQCKDDIAMRPYIILADSNGEQVTLYGGTIYRSIGYIAYQNRSVFQPKTASYNYVWEIIHHVYGDKYDADYKG